jgi:hypothetical protein
MGHGNSNPRTSAPHTAAQAGLEEWHRIVTERDWEQLPALLVDDVTYHNPAQFEPYSGKDALVGILRLVFSIFADFDYHRTFGREDGYTDGADNHDSGPTHLDSASGDTVSAYPNGEVAAAFTTRARPRPSAARVSLLRFRPYPCWPPWR